MQRLNAFQTQLRPAVVSHHSFGPSMHQDEQDTLDKEAQQLEKWMSSDRFKNIKRPYSASDVVRLASPLKRQYPSTITSKKLWKLFCSLYKEQGYSHTFGCLDPIQVAQMAPYVSTIYVSGWQSSSTASSSNEPGPDLADYPSNTVPLKVDQLFKAQDFHARKQRYDRSQMTEEQRKATPFVDYYRPIIADADTGHGGLSAVMKLTKMFIEVGAAAIHIEDQKPGTKKCGHLGGKVLVSTQEHVDRLIAARLQADLMQTELVIVARSDAEAATLLDNNVDSRDHPFILGCTNSKLDSFNDYLKNADSSDFASLTEKWEAAAKLMTYGECVEQAMITEGRKDLIAEWQAKYPKMSHQEARQYAKSLGFTPFWCWEKPRTREGYYRVKGGLDMCVARCLAYACYSDLLWMESKMAVLKDAKYFAEKIKAIYPWAMFAYNLSPSFNWDEANIDDEAIEQFQDMIAKYGYVWQFITLAGFHINSYATTMFARQFKKKKMLAYVADVQRKERKDKVETLTHQKWSGASLVDGLLDVVTGGQCSTTAMKGKSLTENQFWKT